MVDRNRIKIEEVEKANKRGRRFILGTQVQYLIGSIGIVCIYAWSLFKKKDLVDSQDLTRESALFIDSLLIVIYAISFVTLTSALVLFKVLDRKYEVNIKKFQLFIFLLLTTCAMALSVL